MVQFRTSDSGSRAGIMALVAALAIPISLGAQNPQQMAAKPAPVNKIPGAALDPAAMQALKSMSDQLRAAQSFSFTARVMREEPATNGQMLDFFRRVAVQVQRPDKVRLQVQSDNADVNLWYDGRNVSVMPLDGKMYSTIPAAADIDSTLEMLNKQAQTRMPLQPFLTSNPYAFLSDGLQSANSIGMASDGNEQLLHLAFSEPEADWQLWLTGPRPVLPRRMAITYKTAPHQPRVFIDFSDWRLNDAIPASAFIFSKPADAVPVSMKALKPRKMQPGGPQQ